MGLFDRRRGRRTGPAAAGTSAAEIGPNDPGEPDPIQFRPRTDGIYLSDLDALQFSHSKAWESEQTDPVAARTELGGRASRSGEYTAAGRFLVSLPMAPTLTFSVLAVDGGSAATPGTQGPELLLMRRTDTRSGDSRELEYRFQPTA